MRISFVGAVERVASGRLRDRAIGYARIADSILNDRDDRSVSRRIALVTFMVRIVSALIAYLSQVLLARWMGSFEYGIFVIVWVSAVILGGLACLGSDAAVLRFVPEYFQRGQVKLLRGVIIGSRVQAFVVATLFAMLGGLGLYAFGDSLTGYYVIPLYLGAITLPMIAVATVQDGVSRAFSWSDLGLWPTFIIRPSLMLLFMWTAISSGAAADAVTAMAAVIAATYLTSIGQVVWLTRRVKTKVPPGPRQYRPLHWMGVALPMLMVEGFFFLLTNVDVLIVGRFMEPDQVAVYYAAAKTLALVHFIYFAVRTGSAQRFSQYFANGDRAKLAAFVRDTVHWTFWPSLAMVVFLLAAGRLLLALFGPGFESGYPLLFILSIGVLARASIGPAEALLSMVGQQRITAAVYAATFFLNVVLNFSLIPILGLAGAATATALALIAETVSLYVVTQSRLGIRCSIVTALRPARPAIGAS